MALAVDDMVRGQGEEDDALFYRPGYKEKKQAPERIPRADLEALFQASKFAVDQGVVSQEVADALLPMRLVEGRGDFGNNSNTYHNSPKTREAVAKLFGLVGNGILTRNDDPKLLQPIVRANKTYGYNSRSGEMTTKEGDFLVAGEGKEFTPTQFAFLSLLKLATTREKDPLEAAKKYNGAGPLAERYKGRVQEYMNAISRPENQAFFRLIEDLKQKHKPK